MTPAPVPAAARLPGQLRNPHHPRRHRSRHEAESIALSGPCAFGRPVSGFAIPEGLAPRKGAKPHRQTRRLNSDGY